MDLACVLTVSRPMPRMMDVSSRLFPCASHLRTSISRCVRILLPGDAAVGTAPTGRNNPRQKKNALPDHSPMWQGRPGLARPLLSTPHASVGRDHRARRNQTQTKFKINTLISIQILHQSSMPMFPTWQTARHQVA